MEIVETAVTWALTMNQHAVAAENTKPHRAWEKWHLLEFAEEHPTGVGELLCTPREWESTQFPLGSCCPALS